MPGRGMRTGAAQAKEKKDYTFWRQFNEKPSIVPACPGLKRN